MHEIIITIIVGIDAFSLLPADMSITDELVIEVQGM